MSEKCPVCGSEKVITGQLSASMGVVFIPDDQKNRLIMKSSRINACACGSCGEVFGFKLADNPDKLTD